MTLGLDDSSSGDSSESCHPSWVRGCNHWGWEEEGRPIVSVVSGRFGHQAIDSLGIHAAGKICRAWHSLIRYCTTISVLDTVKSKSWLFYSDTSPRTVGKMYLIEPSWMMDDGCWMHPPVEMVRVHTVKDGCLIFPFQFLLSLARF